MKKIVCIAILFSLFTVSCKKDELSYNLKPISSSNSETSNLRKEYDKKLKGELIKKSYIDDSIVGDYQIINGTVHFKSFDTYRKFSSGNDSFKKNFLSTNKNFHSLERLKNELFEEALQLKNEGQANAFIKKNSKFINVVNENLIFLYDHYLSFLFNDRGFFFVGKAIVYFNGTENYIIYNESENKIKELEDGTIDPIFIEKNINIPISKNKKKSKS